MYFLYGIALAAVLAILLGVAYQNNRHRLGRDLAVQNLQSGIFWAILLLLVGASVALVPSPWDTWLTLGIYFAVSLAVAAYLLTWTQRRRQAGEMLVRLRSRSEQRWSMYIGLFFLVLAFVQTLAAVDASFENSAPTPDLLFLYGQATFQWALAIFILAAGRAPVELREGGICDRLSVMRWRNIDGYLWEGSDGERLSTIAENGFPLFNARKTWTVPLSQRPEVAAVVEQKLGDPQTPVSRS